MLEGKRIAVTGASGFLGGRLVAALVAHGARVFGFGRRKNHQLAGASYTAWDIEQGQLPDPPAVETLVHCAGMVTDWGRRSLFERCHVGGTAHVLASFPKSCPVVHVSTASVYAHASGTQRIAEDAPLRRRHLTAYTESKLAAESLVADRGRHAILRPHAIYGPGDTVLLPRLLSAQRAGRMLVPGDGRNQVSLTHVDNLVDAIVLSIETLLESPGREAPGVLNVSDAEPVSIDQALRAMLAGTGRIPRITYVPRALAYPVAGLVELACKLGQRKQEPLLTRYRVVLIADDCVLDLTRARQVLGYAPQRTVFDFIATGEYSSQAARPRIIAPRHPR